MIKAALFTLSLAALLALPATATAQDNAVTLAVNRAVLNQANTIVLRGRLADARATAQRGDIRGAAKQYQEAFVLAQQIGSGIDAETAQAVAGVVSTRLALAREAQSRHDLIEADTQINQVLKVDPKNSVAIIFKQQNDQMLVAMKPHMPDAETIETIPAAAAQKTDANILMQDGKLFYEMGKLDEAEAKLAQALKLDPDNSGASYYLNLIRQARLSRDSAQHMLSTQTRMEQVEKQWVLPTSKVVLPVPNPYATNNLVYTGPGRQAIVDKLNRIHLDNVSYDGVPLNEVLRQLSEKIRLSDPERKGINFIINPNQDQSGAPVAVPATGLGGQGFGGQVLPGLPGANAIDPATGLPATGATPGGAAAGGEPIDAGAFMVKFSLTDVRLADVLNTITMVAQNPNPGDNRTIKYTIQDFAIVFQAKGAESPQLFERSFKVDPNSFYSGLESVSATTFGSSSSSGGGGNGGGGGGGGGNSGGGGGGGNNQNSGAVVGVVNAFAGGGSLRNQGGQGGGGGGGGGGGATGQGAVNPLDAGTAGAGGGGGGGVTGGGGLHYITQVTLASSVSAAASAFFTTLGVNLVNPPGKSVFFNDRVGRLFVRATEQDLDTIERAIETLNEVAPMVHIKARFIEVQQNDNKALGFDWYLGNFLHGDVVAGGGSSPSLTVPVSANNPLGAFPGNTVSSLVPASGNDQLLTQGLRNSGPALATMTGILTDPNFRVVLHALEQRDGVEALAEPDVTTISGRQTQMRATQIKNVVTGFSFNNGTANNGGNNNGNNNGGVNGAVQQPGIAAVIPNTQQLETGPVLDVVPYVLSDGYTINLALIPSVTEFIGYSSIGANEIPGFNPGSTIGGLNGTTLPVALPNFTIRQVVTTVNVWDNQTVVIGGLISSTVNSIKDKVPVIGDIPMLGRLFQSQSKTTVKKNLMIFVTATIVDPSGSRIHSDDDLPFAQTATPVQPEGFGTTSETVKKVQMPVAP
jgi:type II secretory pathway component GspD/PulD (secretin)/tetratricopeptide (TPR) repeat protein